MLEKIKSRLVTIYVKNPYQLNISKDLGSFLESKKWKHKEELIAEYDEKKDVLVIRLTMVSFRHYAITGFYAMSGRNLKATQMFARHRDAATTMRYITVRKSEIDSVIDRMGQKPLKAVQWNEVVG